MRSKYGFFSEGIYSRKGNIIYTSDIFVKFIETLIGNKKYNALGRLTTTTLNQYNSLDKISIYYPLTYYSSITQLFLILPYYLLKNYKTIIKFVQQSNTLFISASSPLSIFLMYLFRKHKKDIILFIRQTSVLSIITRPYTLIINTFLTFFAIVIS